MVISNFLQLFTKSTLNQRETVQMYVTNIAGADPGFFLGGGALVSCSTSTPIDHIVFFLQNTSCIRKPQVISGGGGGVHPLHPPPRPAPVLYGFTCTVVALWNLLSF